MSKGKWDPAAKPDGYLARAELATRLEDAMARLHTTQQEVLLISQLVREIELARKRKSA